MYNSLKCYKEHYCIPIQSNDSLTEHNTLTLFRAKPIKIRSWIKYLIIFFVFKKCRPYHYGLVVSLFASRRFAP